MVICLVHSFLLFSICMFSIYSRMRSEGFPFIVGVWGWTCVRFVLLPRRRLVVANSSPTRYFAAIGRYIRTATPSCLSKYEKWRKSRTKCSFWRSQVTKCEVIFVFCVTGAILWQCVDASASFFRGRRSTLWCGLSRCRGRRSILWRGEGAVSTNRNGSDVQTWHYCKYRGRRRIWWLSWKVAEASQKSYFLSSVKMAL